ncbi:MAG: methyltransferase domain-containing protein [Rhodospirillaceae bacterium]|nr:methyltransferase domain-containing protein [Rhodospirillaceae bacterium]
MTQTWNPELYLRYAAYRARPADDLLPRLTIKTPGAIYDLGCGPGTVTKRLKDAWPDRSVTGVDSSDDMLAEARRKFPDAGIRWEKGDIATWSAPSPAAMVFANAAFHWVPNHPVLIPRLFAQVAAGGTFAFQIPRSGIEPAHDCIRTLKTMPRWAAKLSQVEPHDDPLPIGDYYDLLAPHAADIDLWTTHYVHVLEGDAPVAEWMSSTGLVPYLSVLDKTDHAALIADYAALTKKAYPPRADGKVLFVMPRVFVVALKK